MEYIFYNLDITNMTNNDILSVDTSKNMIQLDYITNNNPPTLDKFNFERQLVLKNSNLRSIYEIVYHSLIHRMTNIIFTYIQTPVS